jgi:hypothetical protein
LKRVKELESIHSHKMCYKDYDTHVCQMTALAREEFEKAKNAPTE